MKVFVKLIGLNVISRDRYHEILEKTIMRLKDSTVNVRKNALKLLISVVCIYKIILPMVTTDKKFIPLNDVIRMNQQTKADLAELIESLSKK